MLSLDHLSILPNAVSNFFCIQLLRWLPLLCVVLSWEDGEGNSWSHCSLGTKGDLREISKGVIGSLRGTQIPATRGQAPRPGLTFEILVAVGYCWCSKSASLYSEPVRYSLLLNYLLLCSINTRFQAHSEEEAQPSPWAERSKAGVGPTANKGTDWFWAPAHSHCWLHDIWSDH